MSFKNSFIAVTAIDNLYRKHLMFDIELPTEEQLPILQISDLQSYFSASPTEAMLAALSKAGLSDENIEEFRYVNLAYAGQYTYKGTEIVVTPEGISEIAHPATPIENA